MLAREGFSLPLSVQQDECRKVICTRLYAERVGNIYQLFITLFPKM